MSQSPPTASTDIAVLERVLGQQLERIRRRYLLHALGLLLCAALSGLLIYYGLDRLLRLPQAVRVLLTLALTTWLGWLIWRRLLYPLRRRLLLTDVALAVETRFPELQDKIISALQLAPALHSDRSRNQSTAMIERVLNDANQHAQRLAFDDLLDPARTRRWWLMAGAVGLCCTALLWLGPAHVGAFLQRMFGSNIGYPRATHLRVILAESADYQLERAADSGRIKVTLAAGGDLPVIVEVDGSIPNSVSLIVEGGQGSAPRIAMTRRGDRVFRHVFRRIRGPLTFHASGGDDPEGDLQVEVDAVPAPRVDGIVARVIFPAYARTKAQEQQGGTIEGLANSNVELEVTGSSDISAASLRFLESETTLRLEPVRIEDDGATRTVFRAAFTLTRSDRYQIDLTGRAGLRNPHPGNYRILVVPDQPPIATLFQPSSDHLGVVLPSAIVPIRLQVRDDFGVATATATLQANSDKSVPTSQSLLAAKPQADPQADPIRDRTLLTLIDLARPAKPEAAAQIGQTLVLQVILEDNREPIANRTELPARQIFVIGETELLRRVSGHFRRIREAVERDVALLTERIERVGGICEDLGSGSKLRDLQVPITTVEVTHNRIGASAEGVHADLMRAFDFHLFNRLDSSSPAAETIQRYVQHHRDHPEPRAFLPAFYQGLFEDRRAGTVGAMEVLDPILNMVELSRQVAVELGPDVVRLLAQARVAKDETLALHSLETVRKQQRAMMQRLQQLLSRLDDWNEFQDLVRDARALREKQRELEFRTRNLQEPSQPDRRNPKEVR